MRPVRIGRWLSVTAGAVALCVGLVVAFGPSTIEGALRWPWADETLLVAFFTVALTIACLVGSFVLMRGVRADPPAEPPERVQPTPPPGRDLERVLDSRWPASLPAARRRRIRARLRRAAVRTIVRTADVSAETARERLEAGTWTDDPVAAAFVDIDRGTDPSRLRSIGDRLRFTRRARRTAKAILARDEEGDRRR